MVSCVPYCYGTTGQRSAVFIIDVAQTVRVDQRPRVRSPVERESARLLADPAGTDRRGPQRACRFVTVG